MIVTQSILYSCWMFVLYRHIYCFNHLSYIYFDMSFSHVQFILCESRTHLTAKQWIGYCDKWLRVIWTHQTRRTSSPPQVPIAMTVKVIDLLGCDALYLVDVHWHSRWICCPLLEGGWPNVADSRFLWNANGYIQIIFWFTYPFCR